jgi:hypothetical protein
MATSSLQLLIAITANVTIQLLLSDIIDFSKAN